jgi:hypothetical protein
VWSWARSGSFILGEYPGGFLLSWGADHGWAIAWGASGRPDTYRRGRLDVTLDFGDSSD